MFSKQRLQVQFAKIGSRFRQIREIDFFSSTLFICGEFILQTINQGDIEYAEFVQRNLLTNE